MNSKKAVKVQKRLTFEVIPNSRVQGKAPSSDRFTLSKDNKLLFNHVTRTKLNIPVPAFVEFRRANEEGEEGNVYLSFHKTRRNANSMKVGNTNSNYCKITVPTAAAKMVGMVPKVAGPKGKRKRSVVHYKGEAFHQGNKKRYIKLTLVEDNA